MRKKTLQDKIASGGPRPQLSKYAAKHPQYEVITSGGANGTKSVIVDEPQPGSLADLIQISDRALDYHFTTLHAGTLFVCRICGKRYDLVDPKTVTPVMDRLKDHWMNKHGGRYEQNA